jgi:hypothetical protein
VARGQARVRVHQCLFGYVDGHRLLASSTQLPEEAASSLLQLSDLAPGLNAAEIGGYWTGVPLLSARRYALLRTWAAPEIRRPGCVWTHALLVGFPDIARFSDLSVLRPCVVRPNLVEGFGAYSGPLFLDQIVASRTKDEHLPQVRAEDALRVIRAIYGTRPRISVAARSGVLDDAIFAAWSQQWPRLRRSFSFQTASGHLDEAVVGARFNLRVLLGPGGLLPRGGEPISSPEAWETAAVDDLVRPQPTGLRRFLWRYGSDIRRGRERFQFLTKLYVSTRLDPFDDAQRLTTLMHVAQAIPAPDEGLVLKQDLAWGATTAYSLIPCLDALDAASFLLEHPELSGLPPPPTEALDAVFERWPARAREIVSVTERAVHFGSSIAEPLLERLTRAMRPETFLGSTGEAPEVRRRILPANPHLLDSDDLVHLQQPELLALLALVPNDEGVARRLIGRLLVVDDPDLATAMLKRFPDASMRSASDSIERSIQTDESLVASAWLRGIAERSAEFLAGGFVQRARSTRVLAAFAGMLHHDSPAVLRTGSAPWSAALQDSTDDVEGLQRQVFLAFLLAVALARPEPGCETLFERAFEAVHRSLQNAILPYEAKAIVTRHVPTLHWWEEWDICFRLRVAVVNAYVEGSLDKRSFHRLTADGNLSEQLIDLAQETRRGRRFLGHVTA